MCNHLRRLVALVVLSVIGTAGWASDDAQINRALQTLRESKDDSEIDSAFYLLTSHWHLPHEAIPIFASWLESENKWRRMQGEDGLAWIGPASIPALKEALRDGFEPRRAAAARVLARFRAQSAPATAELMACLRSEAAETRRDAADALRAIGPAAAESIPALQAAFRGPEFEVHLEGPELLGAFEAGLAAAEALIAVSGSPEPGMAFVVDLLDPETLLDSAMECAGRIGHRAKAAILRLEALLRSEKIDIRLNAARALYGIDPKHPAVWPTLLETARAGHQDEVRWTLEHLGWEGHALVPRLLEVACDRKADPALREMMLYLVPDLGPPQRSGIPMLMSLVEDPQERVRWCATGLLVDYHKDGMPGLTGLNVLLRRLLVSAIESKRHMHVLYLISSLNRLGEEVHPFVHLLRPMLDDEQMWNQIGAFIVGVGPVAGPLAPAVVEQLRSGRDRNQMIFWLGAMGSGAKCALPLLSDMFGTAAQRQRWLEALPKDRRTPEPCEEEAVPLYSVALALARIDPQAHPEAIAFLIEYLKWRLPRGTSIAGHAVETIVDLGDVGPAAKAAIPIIWAGYNIPGYDTERAAVALHAMDPTDSRAAELLITYIRGEKITPLEDAIQALLKVEPVREQAVALLTDIARHARRFPRERIAAAQVLRKWGVDVISAMAQ